MSQLQGIEVRRPSRRTIATGAAWAVPVIAIGASAPALAGSQGIIITFTGLDCKDSGQSGDSNFTYNFQIRIQNTTGVPTPVTLLSATKCDASGDAALTNLNPDSFIAALGTTTANIQADSTNSARDCFLLSYEVDGVVYVATFPGDGGSIKPCCTASEYCPCDSLSKPNEPGCTQ